MFIFEDVRARIMKDVKIFQKFILIAQKKRVDVLQVVQYG